MWIDDTINKINRDLGRLELHKEAIASLVRNQQSVNITNPHGYQKLSDSKIWNRSEDEQKAFDKFNDKIRGYNPYSELQQRVIGFTNTEKQKYRSFSKEKDEGLEKYIDASAFWKKETVTVPAQDKKRLKIVFASNDDMQCVIFKYIDETYVLTTMSSFENYLRDIEGRSTEMPQEKRMKRKTAYKPKVWEPSALYKALEPAEEDATMIANRLNEETYTYE